MPASPKSRQTQYSNPFATFATRRGEKCGLIPDPQTHLLQPVEKPALLVTNTNGALDHITEDQVFSCPGIVGRPDDGAITVGVSGGRESDPVIGHGVGEALVDLVARNPGLLSEAVEGVGHLRPVEGAELFAPRCRYRPREGVEKRLTPNTIHPIGNEPGRTGEVEIGLKIVRRRGRLGIGGGRVDRHGLIGEIAKARTQRGPRPDRLHP